MADTDKKCPCAERLAEKVALETKLTDSATHVCKGDVCPTVAKKVEVITNLTAEVADLQAKACKGVTCPVVAAEKTKVSLLEESLAKVPEQIAHAVLVAGKVGSKTGPQVRSLSPAFGAGADNAPGGIVAACELAASNHQKGRY
jgi:hypothetical protein